MAASSKHRLGVWRYFATLSGIVIVLYCLVFLIGNTNTPKLGLDLQGGTTVTLTAESTEGTPGNTEMNTARSIIENRVNGLGVAEAEVVREGNDRIVISVPGNEGEQAKSLGTTAQLRFRPVIAGPLDQGATDVAPLVPPTPPANISQEDYAAAIARLGELECDAASPGGSSDASDKPLAACGEDGNGKYLLAPTIIEGTEISDASSVFDTQGLGGWSVSLELHGGGQEVWSEYTSSHNRLVSPGDPGNAVAFTLDGQVVSAPVIENTINGPTQVTGDFSEREADQLANSLRYGSLPLTFTQSEALTVSPTLGTDQLQAGLLAGGIGLALVVVYSLLYYRLLGLVTVASLAVSGVLVYACLVLLGREIGFTLTLAGIAGFIVAVGITADSFVVLFERLKDEVREGRSPRSAVPRAWVRARRTILSADAVSFIAAAILYYLAAGAVKGFAFTLGLSTLLDLVVVFLFTRPLVSLASRSKSFSSRRFSGLGSVRRRAPVAASPTEAESRETVNRTLARTNAVGSRGSRE